jgi:hypothetical protein
MSPKNQQKEKFAGCATLVIVSEGGIYMPFYHVNKIINIMFF